MHAFINYQFKLNAFCCLKKNQEMPEVIKANSVSLVFFFYFFFSIKQEEPSLIPPTTNICMIVSLNNVNPLLTSIGLATFGGWLVC